MPDDQFKPTPWRQFDEPTRAWLLARAPEVPRKHQVPWVEYSILTFLAIPTVMTILTNPAAFRKVENFGPALVVTLLFGIPSTVSARRDLLRNRVARDGQPLGFHFTKEATYWRESATQVWRFTAGSVRRVRLTSTFNKLGVFADALELEAADGTVASVSPEYELIGLWHALKAQHPEADAVYGVELEGRFRDFARKQDQAVAAKLNLAAPSKVTPAARPLKRPPARSATFSAEMKRVLREGTGDDVLARLREVIAEAGIKTVAPRHEEPTGETFEPYDAPLELSAGDYALLRARSSGCATADDAPTGQVIVLSFSLEWTMMAFGTHGST